MDEHTYEECVRSSHPCFKHKMRYWREGGAPVYTPYDTETWRNTTVREQARDIVDRAKQNGYDPQPVGNRWV